MKKTTLIIIGAVVALIAVYCISTYNSLAKADQEVASAWSNVETQYQRRSDLIPNLVNTVKGYAAHETQTLESVVAARAAATSVTINGAEMSAEQMALAAGGTLEAVDAILQDSHLLSPTYGTVAQIYPEVGELVTIGTPLLTIVDLSSPYVVFNIREDYMPLFSLGERFWGTVPAIGGEAVEWEVYYIAPLGNYATWRTTRQMSGYDMRTFEIHARPTEAVCGLLSGMSVIVRIEE